MPASLASFLRQQIGMSPGELNAVSSGQPVVKVLDTSDALEIAVFGIVHVAVPRSFYVQSVTNFASSLRDSSRIQFAVLSDPPSPADVRSLSLTHDEVQDLARCRSGACKVKLPADAIAHLHATVDFDAPSADSIVSAYFRSRLIDYVSRYRAHGDSALLVYDDKPTRTAAARVFHDLLSRSPYVYQYAPALEKYLENYPHDRPAALNEALFWSEDDLPGLRTTVTLNHEVVYSPPEMSGTTLIVRKLLYAAHYLDGALDITAVVDDVNNPAAATAGVYLVLLRRLHFDDLPTGGLVDVRRRVVGKIRDRTLASLRDTKAESEWAHSGG